MLFTTTCAEPPFSGRSLSTIALVSSEIILFSGFSTNCLRTAHTGIRVFRYGHCRIMTHLIIVDMSVSCWNSLSL